MAMAIALVVIVAGSVLFHFLSPWRATPLASNWREMDDTLAITLAITGLFFVVINLFVVYILVRYRHRPGSRAAYEPDNKKLERWLIAGTTVGIVALLAPGLIVYMDYVRAPKEAIEVEVLGQQWQWRFRFPDGEGKLGSSDARFVSADNPFGLNPDDPSGWNNVLVNKNELHLPLNKPVKILLRSHDVLHDFYVPQFRARMNMVPGMVTSFWFTPTKAGRYEILCAQLCGVGHSNMKGYVVVEDEATFQAWLKEQPTYAMTKATPGSGGTEAGAVPAGTLVEQGKVLAQSKGCVACHSIDGSPGVGPTWKGLAGKNTTLADGSSVPTDETYLKKSIRDPQSQVVKGFQPIMPKTDMTDDELDALLAYIQSLGATAAAGAAPAAIQNVQLDKGKALAQSKGCVACHSIDGSPGVGPTWKGISGKATTLADGSTVPVDEVYLKKSIREPQSQVVKGFQPIMPKAAMTDDELSALVAYIQSVGGAAPAPAKSAQGAKQ
jgi:cytochrome c oxidase subunit 2